MTKARRAAYSNTQRIYNSLVSRIDRMSSEGRPESEILPLAAQAQQLQQNLDTMRIYWN